MPLKLPADTKLVRIAHQLVGPIQRLEVPPVPSDWVLYSSHKGSDLLTSVKELRRLALSQGDDVDDGSTVEDRRPITEMMRS